MKQVYVFDKYTPDSFVVADKELADAIAKAFFTQYKAMPLFAEGALYRPLDEAEDEDEEADDDAVEF